MGSVSVQTQEDAADLLRGLTLLGTGGGGFRDMGRWYLQQHLEEGRFLTFVPAESIPDDAWTCSVFGMGSSAPTKPLDAAQKARLGYGPAVVERPMVEAVRQLSEYTGLAVAAIVSLELGAANTCGPLDAAARLGIPFVDGDYCGRAVPMMTMTTPAIHGAALCPLAVCDAWGNVVIIRQASSTLVAERLGKAISTISKLPDPKPACAHAGILLKARDMKRMVVPGTVSRALDVGREIRRAKAQGDDPAAAAARATGGWVLFTGVVAEMKWESRDGYHIGTTTIDGRGTHEGHSAKIWYQNENHILWVDGAPRASSPDLIAVMERSGEPHTNADLAKGMEVAVVGAAAHPAFRAPEAVRALEPRFFGFDIAYRPIENAMTGG